MSHFYQANFLKPPHSKMQKYWQDLRSKTEKKKSKQIKYARGTGGGPPLPPKLDITDELILSTIAPTAITGDTNISETPIDFDFTFNDRMEDQSIDYVISDEGNEISKIIEWNLDYPKQAEKALNYLFSSPENGENSDAEADSDAEDQLDALDTESASRSGRNTSSAASSTSSIFTNYPVIADYNFDGILADETLAEVVLDSQACDKTEHNLSPDNNNVQ
ncbi:hypothetical protein JTB14_006783 [Gonioctena quinquepunctata]|nr:hypothetical protein JTB14_006783 [Gonioctena quinquepunctata]